MTKPTQAQVKKIMMGMKDKKPVKVILRKNHVGEDGQYPLLLSDTQLNKLNKSHGAGLGCGLTLGKKQLQESMNLSRTMGSGWIKDIYTFFKPSLKEVSKSALTAYVGPAAGPITDQAENFIDKGVDWLDKKLSPKKKYTKAEKDAILKKEKIRQEKQIAEAKKRVAETMSKRRTASKAAKVSNVAQLGPAQLDDEGEMNKLEDEDVEPQQSGVFIPSGTGGIIPFGGMMQYEECECPHCEGSGFILNALTRAVQKNLMPRRQGPPPRMMRGMPNRQGMPRRGGELSAPGREAGPTQLY